MNTPISQINSIVTIDYLQGQPENQYFERKGWGERDIKAAKIADELIGMLNADGGILALGISDDGQIQDLRERTDKLDEYRKLAFDYIHPPCHIQLEEIEIGGKLIFLFHVESDLERIYSRKDTDKVFLRVADSNRELNREQIKNWNMIKIFVGLKMRFYLILIKMIWTMIYWKSIRKSLILKVIF